MLGDALGLHRIGVEGASVISARANSKRDVGRATILGFLVALLVICWSPLLSLGVMNQPGHVGGAEEPPSMAGVMRNKSSDAGERR